MATFRVFKINSKTATKNAKVHPEMRTTNTPPTLSSPSSLAEDSPAAASFYRTTETVSFTHSEFF